MILRNESKEIIFFETNNMTGRLEDGIERDDVSIVTLLSESEYIAKGGQM